MDSVSPENPSSRIRPSDVLFRSSRSHTFPRRAKDFRVPSPVSLRHRWQHRKRKKKENSCVQSVPCNVPCPDSNRTCQYATCTDCAQRLASASHPGLQRRRRTCRSVIDQLSLGSGWIEHPIWWPCSPFRYIAIESISPLSLSGRSRTAPSRICIFA